MTQELRRLLGLCIGLVSVALFPLSAFAENYYWTAYLNADRGHYSSPEAACQRLESAVAPMAGSSQTAVYSHKVKSTKSDTSVSTRSVVTHWVNGRTSASQPTM